MVYKYIHATVYCSLGTERTAGPKECPAELFFGTRLIYTVSSTPDRNVCKIRPSLLLHKRSGMCSEFFLSFFCQRRAVTKGESAAAAVACPARPCRRADPTNMRTCLAGSTSCPRLCSWPSGAVASYPSTVAQDGDGPTRP